MLRRIRPYLGIFLTTAFLGLMLYAVDLEASLNALMSADPFILVAALISANIPLLVYAAVWRRVLSITGLELDYFTTLRLVLANTFVNNITPFGNIGGEAASTYILSKISGKSYGQSFTAVFTASIINFSPLITFLLFGGLYTGLYDILILPVLALTLYVLIKNTELSIPVPASLEDFSKDFSASFDTVKNSGKSLWSLISVTHLAFLFDVISIFLIGLSLGLDFYSASLFFVVPLARAANYVPTPGGTGPYELALSGLLAYFFPVSFHEAVVVAIIYRVLTYYTGILVGYFAINSFQIGEKGI
ncbi:lysylphosphatidylglycerol synthase transmembrane domain-containing protein [Candidatus Nanosalina sp. VS9-1]|uniref:lysylphosphatidylglycerol synthase transmembrane domain-containing protein n=1 Tax=Candidatus Nanosalina sp. VS9-1 TaxID=3388566 RepID=UPI0039DFA713